MLNGLSKRNKVRKQRVLRVRKKLRGTSMKPRLSVLKTNKNLSVQVIDDENGVTLASFGTNVKELKNSEMAKKSTAAAKHIGEKIAHILKEKKIEKVVFDRGRYKYHGLIAQLADAAREAGLQF